jgi:GT2 family glycosyltransferase
MLVSVFVLYYKSEDLQDTVSCVEHLKKSSYLDIELICVNNGLNRNFEKELRKIYPKLKHIDLKFNTGFTGGNIEALKHATGDVVCLLNNDAIIHPESIRSAVELLKSDEKIAVAGGKIYTLSDNHPPLRESNPFHTYQKVNPFSGDAVTLKFNPIIANVDSVSGSLMFIRKSVIDEIGFLDDRFFAYYEETDFCARAQLAGYKIKFSDSIKLWHRDGSLNPDPRHQRFFYFQMFKNQFLFAANNFSDSAFKNYLRIYLNRIRNIGSLKVSLKRSKSPERYFYQSAQNILINLPKIIKARVSKNLKSKPKLEGVLPNNIQDLSLIIDSKQDIKGLIGEIKNLKLKVQEVLIIIKDGIDKPSSAEIAKLNKERGYEFIRIVETKLFNPYHKAAIEANSNNICFTTNLDANLCQMILLLQKNSELKFSLDSRENPSVIMGSKNNWIEYFAMQEVKDIPKHIQDLGSKQVCITKFNSETNLKFDNHKLSLQQDPLNYPIFINCRDRLDPLKELLTWLKKEGCSNIILIDNNSSNPKLLRFYDKSDLEVIKLNENAGHISLWDRSIIDLIDKNQRFIYSDPDIIPEPDSHGAIVKFNDLLDKYTDMKKVGFGLSLDTIPDSYHLKEDVIRWEQKFWQKQVEPQVFEAPIDTTFAMYEAGCPYLHEPALRTGGKLVARHEPWHTDSHNVSEDLKFYLDNADRASNSWGSSSDEGIAHHQKISEH